MKFHPDSRKFSRAYRKFLYLPMGRLVLLLTTTGRKTGRAHTIGLQYEYIGGKYIVAAADGTRADWYRNLLQEPRVEIQVGRHTFQALAATEYDPDAVCDFLEYRLKKHPLMIRAILRMDGFKGQIDRAALARYAASIRMVVLTPTASRA
jgi:deazaflavin-dependent oxidoreductase (nitroreductase family)